MLLKQLTELALEHEQRLREGHDHLVNYLFVKDDKVVYAENQACYYQVENGVPWKSGITGIISSLERAFTGNYKEDVIRKWLEFHTSDPVFGKSILSKDVDWMMEHRLVIHDTSAPGNLMQGVMVSIRQLWEYSQICYSYYELIKSGINPTLAYNLAHFLRVEKDRYQWCVYNTGHGLFTGYSLTNKHIKNWLEEKPDNMRKPYFEESRYNGTSNMFDRNVGYRDCRYLNSWLEAFFQRMMKPKQEESSNPFGKAKANNVKNTFPIEEFNEALKKHEQDIIKEIMTNA